MEEKIVLILNEMSEYLSVPQMKKLQEVILRVCSDKTESKQLTQSEIIKKAQDAYDDAQAAMKKGDWAEYGKHMDELEKYLKKLK